MLDDTQNIFTNTFFFTNYILSKLIHVSKRGLSKLFERDLNPICRMVMKRDQY